MKAEFPEASRVTEGPFASPRNARYGLFQQRFPGNLVLSVIADDGAETGWEHVSVTVVKLSGKNKRPIDIMPTWEIMATVKDAFWDEEEEAFQFHPPKSQYVNQHHACLHIWRPVGGGIALPPSGLVGFNKGEGSHD